jgi:hypothetical protein
MAALLLACSAPLGAEESAGPVAALKSPEVPKPAAAPDPTYPPQAYWDGLALGMHSGSRTVDEAAALAEIVVIGRWVAVEPDKGYGAPGEIVVWYATAIIDVEEVLRGVGDVKPGDRVRVPFSIGFNLPGGAYPEHQAIEADKTRPSGSAILFLVSWSRHWDRAQTDVPDWLRDLDKPDLYRLIGPDGAVPLVGDAVSDVVYEIDMPPWRLDAAGRSLADLAAEIVAAPPSRNP